MARRQNDPDSYLDCADSTTIEWWKTRQEIPLSLKICGAADIRPHGICWVMAESCGGQREAVLVFEEVSFGAFKQLAGALRVLQSEFRLGREQGMGFLLFCHVYSLERQSPMTSRVLPSQALLPVVERPLQERLTAAAPLFQLGGLLKTWNHLKPLYNGVAGISPEQFGEFDYRFLPPPWSDRARRPEGSTPVTKESARMGKSPSPGVGNEEVDERPGRSVVIGSERPNSLTKDGASWKLVFEGDEYEGIGHVVGMHYIAQCLSASEGVWLDPATMMLRAGRRPSNAESVSADDVRMAAAEGLSVVTGFDRADSPDRAAEGQYGARLAEIKVERLQILAAFEERPGKKMLDEEVVSMESLEEEEKKLNAQLSAAKKRRTVGPADLGFRKRNVEAVWAGIKLAFRLIKAQDGGNFEEFFRGHIKRQSYEFRFQRDENDPKAWVVGFGDGGDGGDCGPVKGE